MRKRGVYSWTNWMNPKYWLAVDILTGSTFEFLRFRCRFSSIYDKSVLGNLIVIEFYNNFRNMWSWSYKPVGNRMPSNPKSKAKSKREKCYTKPQLPFTRDFSDEEPIPPLSPILCNHYFPQLELVSANHHGLYWVSIATPIFYRTSLDQQHWLNANWHEKKWWKYFSENTTCAGCRVIQLACFIHELS